MKCLRILFFFFCCALCLVIEVNCVTNLVGNDRIVCMTF